MTFDPQPVTLTGRHVRLEPLSEEHYEGLIAVAVGRRIFAYFPIQIETPAEIRAYLDYCRSQMASGQSVTFTTVDLATGRPVGGTSFLAIDHAHRKLEIGGTWLAPDWQRTPANTEAKLLQLTHAFEDLSAVRVEFKTDSLNEKSRNALTRIGAVEEGTMRNHIIVQPSGRHRHSVYFSVIASEWPAVKVRLRAMLAR